VEGILYLSHFQILSSEYISRFYSHYTLSIMSESSSSSLSWNLSTSRIHIGHLSIYTYIYIYIYIYTSVFAFPRFHVSHLQAGLLYINSIIISSHQLVNYIVFIYLPFYLGNLYGFVVHYQTCIY
jgi:hypothetical protein